VVFNNNKATRYANLAVFLFYVIHFALFHANYESALHVSCKCFLTLPILFWKQIAAFGGNKVMSLLEKIERCHQRFKMPPIGPIGAHLV
jgi:hypothetical protein